MADNFEDEYDNDNGATDQNDGSPKALRDAYNKQKAQNAALEKTIKELSDKVRTREIADKLSTRGINAKVAKFIPENVELDDWLKENGDLFGVPASDGGVGQPTEVQQAQAEPHPLQSQFANLASATEGAQAPTGTVDAAKAQEALATGGLEGYEAYIRSHATAR